MQNRVCGGDSSAAIRGKQLLVVLEDVFVVLGIIALSYVTVVIIEARRYQTAAYRQFSKEEIEVHAFSRG